MLQKNLKVDIPYPGREHFKVGDEVAYSQNYSKTFQLMKLKFKDDDRYKEEMLKGRDNQRVWTKVHFSKSHSSNFDKYDPHYNNNDGFVNALEREKDDIDQLTISFPGDTRKSRSADHRDLVRRWVLL